MKPKDLGLPERFTDWRPHQLDAILEAATADTQYVWLDQPTGSGKSPTYMAVSNLLMEASPSAVPRVCVLTATKGLMTQLIGDFGNLIEVKGQNNYRCIEVDDPEVTVDLGDCHSGYDCPQQHVCLYPLAVRKASLAKSVVTNYPFFMHQARNSGIGYFDVLVLDEAHAVPEQLSEHVAVHLSAADLKMIDALKLAKKPKQEDPELFKEWGSLVLPRVREMVGATAGKLNKQYRDLVLKLERLRDIDSEWVHDEFQNGSFTWEPVWPGRFAQRHLFLGTRKILFSSATARPKTFSLLGVPSASVTRVSTPHPIPIYNRPFIFIPTAKVSQKWTPDDRMKWLRRIDEIAEAWPRSKGIIHTVSYERAMMIRNASKFASRMLVHTPQTTREVITHFRNSDKPLILLSPSVTTGYDMPDVFSWQIIAKIPFPDSRSKIMARRSEQDKAYPMYLAMRDMAQAYGRGPRTLTGRCVTYVIDDNIRWVRSAYGMFAPQYLWDAYRLQAGVHPLPAWSKGVI